MGSLYAKTLIETALNEVGYECGPNKWNKYADELDRVDYFTGCGKKQNLDYCSVFTSWCAYKSTIPEPSVWDAHFFLYQSDSCDMAAVVKYAAQYYKDNDAYFTESSKIERGDQVFFKNSNGFSHTGWVVDWDDNGFYTVEGNVNGGRVEKRFYRYGDIGGYVAGFGRPRYDGWELETANNNTNNNDTNTDPEPQPQPEPTPTPTKRKFKVVTSGGALRLRAEPNTDSEQVGYNLNGQIIEVEAIVDGEEIGGVYDWALTSDGVFYNGNTSGYCSCKYLEEV